jgi:GDPmannose 4,6-dehydratase
LVDGAGRQPISAWIPESKGFSYHALDLNNLSALTALLYERDPGFIFHLAAVHGAAGFRYEDHWLESHTVNTLATHVVLEHQRRHAPNSVLVYASSSKAFDPTQVSLVSESTPRRSTCIYSTTKNAATDLIAYYRRMHRIMASVVWTFNHESPRRGGDYFIPRVVAILANSILDNTYSGQVGTLRFSADWGDAAEYMKFVGDIAERAPGKDFVLASGTNLQATQFVSELFGRHHLRWQDHLIERDSVPISEPAPALHADLTALRAALGRVPQRSIYDVCDQILNRNHPEAWLKARRPV